eukprot:UN10697
MFSDLIYYMIIISRDSIQIKETPIIIISQLLVKYFTSQRFDTRKINLRRNCNSNHVLHQLLKCSKCYFKNYIFEIIILFSVPLKSPKIKYLHLYGQCMICVIKPDG